MEDKARLMRNDQGHEGDTERKAAVSFTVPES
jgi:hypothetical protein